MIQPGRETNMPNSADMMNRPGVYGTSIFKLDGFTVTLGMVLLMIVGLLIWQTFFVKGRR